MGIKRFFSGLWNGFDPVPASQEPRRDTNDGPEVSEVAPVLGELADAVNALHSQMTLLRLEWTEVLDKLNAWTNRQSARDRIATKKRLERMSDDGQELEEELPAPHQASERKELPPNGEGNAHPPTVQGYRHPKADLYSRVNRSR
jgi:hypothetical protein